MQAIEGVPKISQDYNPATWMLEITNTAVENRTGQDFAALYASSDMNKCALLTPAQPLPFAQLPLCSQNYARVY